jgi:hypothetical protein
VAISESVLVRYDYASARPAALSPEYVAAIEAFEGRALRAATPESARAAESA